MTQEFEIVRPDVIELYAHVVNAARLVYESTIRAHGAGSQLNGTLPLAAPYMRWRLSELFARSSDTS
jgi:hypothetical protein